MSCLIIEYALFERRDNRICLPGVRVDGPKPCGNPRVVPPPDGVCVGVSRYQALRVMVGGSGAMWIVCEVGAPPDSGINE